MDWRSIFSFISSTKKAFVIRLVEYSIGHIVPYRFNMFIQGWKHSPKLPLISIPLTNTVFFQSKSIRWKCKVTFVKFQFTLNLFMLHLLPEITKKLNVFSSLYKIYFRNTFSPKCSWSKSQNLISSENISHITLSTVR